jgi:hypothetical protein
MKHNELPLGWIEVTLTSGLPWSVPVHVIHGVIEHEGGYAGIDTASGTNWTPHSRAEVLRRIAEAQRKERAATVVAAYITESGPYVVTQDGRHYGKAPCKPEWVAELPNIGAHAGEADA